MKTDSKYNEEKVFWCARCLSLAILEEEGICYCKDCNGVHIHTGTIEQWNSLYYRKYGKKFLDKEKTTWKNWERKRK